MRSAAAFCAALRSLSGSRGLGVKRGALRGQRGSKQIQPIFTLGEPTLAGQLTGAFAGFQSIHIKFTRRWSHVCRILSASASILRISCSLKKLPRFRKLYRSPRPPYECIGTTQRLPTAGSTLRIVLIHPRLEARSCSRSAKLDADFSGTSANLRRCAPDCRVCGRHAYLAVQSADNTMPTRVTATGCLRHRRRAARHVRAVPVLRDMSLLPQWR
jgi:hypothetical protein